MNTVCCTLKTEDKQTRLDLFLTFLQEDLGRGKTVTDDRETVEKQLKQEREAIDKEKEDLKALEDQIQDFKESYTEKEEEVCF